MVQAAMDSGTRDVCTLTATARPVAGEVKSDTERFWASHVGAATFAAMLAPVATVIALSALPTSRSKDSRQKELPSTSAPRLIGWNDAVTGRVLDDAGHPAAQVAVRVVSAKDAAPVGVATTNGQGTFRVGHLGSRRIRVIAENATDGLVESAELDVEAARDVVLVLAHARGITGVVVDERSVPVPYANVKAWGGSRATEKLAITDDEGRFVIDRVAPCADRITAWARGFGASTRILGGVSSTAFEVTLRASPPIEGLVTGPTGRPVAGARITACEDGAPEAAISDAAGRFELPAPAVGCSARAAHPRFSASHPVAIEAGRELVIRMATGGVIEGALVDARGQPVNSFSVTIESYSPADGEWQGASRAGETRDELRGAFRLDDLAAGIYVIHASTPEGRTSGSQTVEIQRGKAIRGVSLALPAEDVGSVTAFEEPAGEGEP